MSNDQYTAPMLIRDGDLVKLCRMPFRDGLFDEDWLQKLLFDNRALLPFSELEPAFCDSLPIARELPTKAGPIDLIYINSKGNISLIETKLCKNPEARRVVVAQIIDYAKEIAEWDYDDLILAIKKANKLPETSVDPLIKKFSEEEGDDFDEQYFFDNITRTLEQGRFLLLIVGDGITEGVEKLTQFFQQTPHLRYSLSLVELAIYRENPDSENNLYVQPRILMRTKEITRAIVELKIPISKSDITITVPAESSGKSTTIRQRITEEVFLEELQKSSGDDAVAFAKWILDHAKDIELRVDWKDAGPLLKYDDPDSGKFFTLGQLHKDGSLAGTAWLSFRFRKLGWPLDTCLSYLDDLVALIPNALRKSFQTKSGSKKMEQVVYGENPTRRSHPPFLELEPNKIKWFDAMETVIKQIRKLSAANEKK